jgi:hypothetical protein
MGREGEDGWMDGWMDGWREEREEKRDSFMASKSL